MKILVADDSNVSRKYITKIIKKNYQNIIVDNAENGQIALEKCKKNRYNVILMDIVMPVMNGIKAGEEIRKLKGYASLPIIFLSSEADDSTINAAMDHGNDYFIKPVDEEMLINKIQKLNKYYNTVSKNSLSDIIKVEKKYLENFPNILLTVLDVFDEYTGGHNLRVGNLAKKIGQQIHLPWSNCNNLLYTGFLHDIGKVGVNINILRKPGKLLEEEWIEMKKHAEFSATIVSTIDAFAHLVPSIKFHHERLDGNGYYGLYDKEIPMEAKILAVCDVWDALTSNRPYRTAMSKEKAVTIMKEGIGRQFDKSYVDTLLLLITF